MSSAATGIDRRLLRRRAVLEMGTAGALGLTLPGLLRGRAAAAASDSEALGRARRCILVFLNGGPSHIDTWDMKLDAPAEVRGELQPIDTNVPGIQTCELLPLLSRHVDRLKIVRSVSHACTVHTTGVYTMLTGVQHATPTVDQTQSLPDDHPHLGSIYAFWRGWKNHLPPFVSLPLLFRAPPVTGIWPGQNAGFLGQRYDPFVISGEKQTAEFTVPDVTLSAELGGGRVERRRDLLGQLDSDQRLRKEQSADLDNYYQQAFDLLQSNKLRSAADLRRETAATHERYGRHLFGQGLLLARRLSEAGLPLVTVYWIDPTPAGAGGGEFDSHGRIYHHMRNRLFPPADRALAALVGDLTERGLWDDTLLVVMSEFGRTPRINADAGRDHWPQAQSVLLAGAGISGGTIHGATDKIGAYPTRDPIPPEDFAQTLLHLLGVPAEFMLRDQLNRPLPASAGTAQPALWS